MIVFRREWIIVLCVAVLLCATIADPCSTGPAILTVLFLFFGLLEPLGVLSDLREPILVYAPVLVARSPRPPPVL